MFFQLQQLKIPQNYAIFTITFFVKATTIHCTCLNYIYSLYPLQESNYFTPQGEFRVDSGGAPTLLNCLMYKLCYHRFGEVQV